MHYVEKMIVLGHGAPGFYELIPLFSRNRAALRAAAGEQDGEDRWMSLDTAGLRHLVQDGLKGLVSRF